MRTIKFKAWDNGCMVGPIGLLLKDAPEWIDGLSSGAELLQYTGLKDRNCVEIYEGDVLRWTIHCLDGKIIQETAPVVFENGSFWMGKNQSGFETCNDWLRGEYEVLGNIHENPELFEG